MKLAVISSSAPFGKGESFVISEINAIAASGHEVKLIPTQLRNGNLNLFELNDQVRLVAQASTSFKVLSAFCLFSLKRPKHLFSLFRLVSDKSLLNSFKNFFVIPKAIWLSNLLNEEGIEHVHAHWLTTSATLAFVSNYLTGVPWSCTAHRGDIVTNNLINEKCKSAGFIRFISKSGVELIKSRGGLVNDKTHVIHIGIDMPDINIESEERINKLGSNLFTILCPANLVSVKGHYYLLEAIAKMKFGSKIQLILAGDGKLRSELNKQVKRLRIHDQVQFRGHIPYFKLLQLYKSKQVDLVVLPSLDLGNGLHEGIPVSLMEAMSYGIPVISTSTGGIPELLEGESNELKYGVIVSSRNSEELATEMDKMVVSESYRKRWSELGRLRIKDAFNQRKTVKSLLKLIEGSS